MKTLLINKYLSVGALVSSILISQALGDNYDQINMMAQTYANNITHYEQDSSFEPEQIHSLIALEARVISWGSRKERTKILSYLSYLYKDFNRDKLTALLCHIGLRHFREEYASLSYKSKDPKEGLRRYRALCTLDHILNENVDEKIRYQLFWLLRRIFGEKEKFNSTTQILECFFCAIAYQLPESIRVPNNDAGFFELKNLPVLSIPEDKTFALFNAQWGKVDSGTAKYKNWSIHNGGGLGKIIERGTYPDLVAQLTGYLFSLDKMTIDGIKRTIKQKEYFWNKKRIQQEKQKMNDAVDALHSIEKHSQEERLQQQTWITPEEWYSRHRQEIDEVNRVPADNENDETLSNDAENEDENLL